MCLPIQKAPTYKCVLPVSNIEVKFRPFLVKEQNHLLLQEKVKWKKKYLMQL